MAGAQGGVGQGCEAHGRRAEMRGLAPQLADAKIGPSLESASPLISGTLPIDHPSGADYRDRQAHAAWLRFVRCSPNFDQGGPSLPQGQNDSRSAAVDGNSDVQDAGGHFMGSVDAKKKIGLGKD